MNDQEMAARYRNDFLKVIEEQAEMGDWGQDVHAVRHPAPVQDLLE